MWRRGEGVGFGALVGASVGLNGSMGALVGTMGSKGAFVGAGTGRRVGDFVGDGVGQFSRSSTCVTPHDVDAHEVLENARSRSTPSSTHQPRSWSKALALRNMALILVTLLTCVEINQCVGCTR